MSQKSAHRIHASTPHHSSASRTLGSIGIPLPSPLLRSRVQSPRAWSWSSAARGLVARSAWRSWRHRPGCAARLPRRLGLEQAPGRCQTALRSRHRTRLGKHHHRPIKRHRQRLNLELWLAFHDLLAEFGERILMRRVLLFRRCDQRPGEVGNGGLLTGCIRGLF